MMRNRGNDVNVGPTLDMLGKSYIYVIGGDVTCGLLFTDWANVPLERNSINISVVASVLR